MTNEINKIHLFSEEEKRNNKFDICIYLFKVSLFLFVYSLLSIVYKDDSNIILILIYLITLFIASITIYRNYLKKIVYVEYCPNEFKMVIRKSISKFSTIKSNNLTLELGHIILQKDIGKFSLLKVRISTDFVQNENFRISTIDLINLLFFLRKNNGKILYDYDLRELLNLLIEREDFLVYHEKIKLILN
jgi:hypothetical protein